MIRAMSAQRSVVSSAKLIAVCTLTSRITGLVRDVLLAHAFGLGWVQDAWVYAFQFPNLFRRLLGEGAMAAAFVPTFTRTLENDGREAAWRLLARTLALITVALSGLIVVIAGVLGVIWLLSTGAGEELEARRLLLSLTALMLPFMLTICVLALFASILNCVGSFALPALAPVLLNVCMILGIGWIAPALRPHDDHGQVYIIALVVVFAGVLQLLSMLPVLRAHGVRLGWRLDARDPTVRRMLKLLVPVALGQGVLVVGVFLDAQICILLTRGASGDAAGHLLGWSFNYPLEEGALSAVTYAQRLYQFPLGVLVISLATAALPAFSRLAARQDWPALTGEVRQALRLAVFEGVAAGTMMIVLAAPLLRFLFEYGQFTAQDTQRASRVLTCYGFGLWAFCAQHIVLRAFYSLQDVRTPLKISVVLLPLNVALSLVMVWVGGIREAAFAISSCTTSTLAVVVGLAILQRRFASRLVDGQVLLAAAKMLVAAGLAALALKGIGPSWAAVAERVTVPLAARALETLGLLALGSGVFLVAAWLLRLPELSLLVSRLPRDASAGGE